MATIKENFKYVRGDTYVRYFSIDKLQYSPITEIYYTVKEDQHSKPLVIKTLGKGIELLSEDDEKWHYMLSLNCNCTDKLKAETRYMHDIQVVSDNVKQTLMKGELYLEKEVTTTYCEGGNK